MKRILSILLALLVLTSNIHVGVSTHYCRGKVYSTFLSFGQDHTGCGMEDEGIGCDLPQEYPVLSKRSCCENQFLKLSADNPLETVVSTGSAIDFPFFIPVLTAAFRPSIYEVPEVLVAYADSSPPWLDKDIPVFIQSFLI